MKTFTFLSLASVAAAQFPLCAVRITPALLSTWGITQMSK